MDRDTLTTIFTENLNLIPIDQIEIVTIDGPKNVDALILGDWALNENSDGWTVTHRKSGYAGKAFPTPIEALISLGIYLGAGLLSFPETITPETFRAIPDIRGIGQRAKAGVVTLQKWDIGYEDVNYEPEDVA